MRIEIKVRHGDLADMLQLLKEQMSYYGSNVYQPYEKVLMGDKFNVYLYRHPVAMTQETWRALLILPKDTPM